MDDLCTEGRHCGIDVLGFRMSEARGIARMPGCLRARMAIFKAATRLDAGGISIFSCGVHKGQPTGYRNETIDAQGEAGCISWHPVTP